VIGDGKWGGGPHDTPKHWQVGHRKTFTDKHTALLEVSLSPE